MAILVKFSGHFNYKPESVDLISSQAVRHEAGILQSALTMDGRQGPGEKNVAEQFSQCCEKCNTPVVTTDQFLSLTFLEGQTYTLSPVIRRFFMDPNIG